MVQVKLKTTIIPSHNKLQTAELCAVCKYVILPMGHVPGMGGYIPGGRSVITLPSWHSAAQTPQCCSLAIVSAVHTGRPVCGDDHTLHNTNHTLHSTDHTLHDTDDALHDTDHTIHDMTLLGVSGDMFHGSTWSKRWHVSRLYLEWQVTYYLALLELRFLLMAPTTSVTDFWNKTLNK